MTALATRAPRAELALPEDAETFLSYGMGVDSSAAATELILNPDRRPFRLDRLTVLIAIVGPADEYRDIRHQVEEYVFPLLAAANVRTVQVARNGPRAADGYSVLSDTRRPKRLAVEKARWALSGEMLRAATVPQVSATRRSCSDRAKHWALNSWIRDNGGHRPHRHVIGFSSEETARIELDHTFASDLRRPWHPLADWQWTREISQAYLETVYGERFVRSCCSFCPFQYNKDNMLRLAERWTREPEAGAAALEMEYIAVRFNPKAYLFGKHSALEFAREHRLEAALTRLHARIEEVHWGIYDVRRVYRESSTDPGARGQTWRAVCALGFGSRGQAELALHHFASATGGPIEADVNGFERVTVSRRRDGYPATERYLVACPATAINKKRARFEELWDATHPIVGIDVADVAALSPASIENAEWRKRCLPSPPRRTLALTT